MKKRHKGKSMGQDRRLYKDLSGHGDLEQIGKE